MKNMFGMKSDAQVRVCPEHGDLRAHISDGGKSMPDFNNLSNNLHLSDEEFADMMAKRFTQEYDIKSLKTADDVFNEIIKKRKRCLL